jgi:hypothetical protein
MSPSRAGIGSAPRAVAAALLAVGVTAAGCGAGRSVASTSTTRPQAPKAFAWLHPAPPASGWSQVRLGGSAALAYPASWQRIKADPGAASAAVVARRSGLIVQYLNATPRQGGETLANWATFRPDHNGDEGDTHVHVLSWARNLPFRDGRGSCVIDRYRTTLARYQEIACLVRAPASETVIVAAALASRWAQDAPVLERAVSAFLA